VLGKAGVAKYGFDREGAARNVARVFEDAAVSCHQGRRREAKDLPEREVPRHHREDDAERLERDERLRVLDRDVLASEVASGVRREVLAGARALVDFGDAVADRLAHLGGHQRGELVAPRAQHVRGLRHAARPLGKVGAPPASLRVGRAPRDVGCLGRGVTGVALASLLRRRVLGLEDRPLVDVRHGTLRDATPCPWHGQTLHRRRGETAQGSPGCVVSGKPE